MLTHLFIRNRIGRQASTLCFALALTAFLQPAYAQEDSFVGMMSMKVIQEMDTQKPSSVNIDLYFEKGRTAMVVRKMGQSVRLLMLDEPPQAYVLVEQQGMKIAMPVNPNQVNTERQAETSPRIEVTDQYRDIAGYRCRKILAYYEDNRSVQWCTKALAIDVQRIMGTLSSQSKKAGQASKFELDRLQEQYGHPMYAEMYRTKGGKEVMVSTLEVIQVDTQKPDPRYFKMDGYQRFDMQGSFPSGR